MRLFKRQNESKSASSGKQVRGLIQQLKRLERGLADKLEYRFGLLSLRSQKVLLVVFLSTLIIANVGIAVQSILDSRDTIKIKQLPKPINNSAGKIIIPDSIITKSEYNRVELLKAHLFQMQNDTSNRGTFDSIMSQNPRLFDSISAFEKMYLSQ